ncbi:MAG TPA: hypothetical protein PK878_13425 [bacterium]|mgnify:CR=1 FL=1|nr:hypothetical protein [Candidatus Omnitrophota bacterium]HOJ61280.1 hypothetical protein [bacterium]HOL93094.1 hypothetical protein [bacterium]HPP02452.1 hypothetical protein [bacterium]
MKKLMPLLVLILAFSVLSAGAQPKKIALSARISWAPGSEGSTNDRDFAVMQHFSMDDEYLRYMLQEWGYFPILMPDYVLQYMLNEGQVPFPPGHDADYGPWVDDGVYMNYPTFLQDEGYKLLWNTGTCWSTIGPAVKELPVPVIQGEHANVGARADKLGSTYMFEGSQSGDISGEAARSITLTDAGKTHELTQGLPEEIVVYGDGPSGPPANAGQAWQGIFDLVDNAAEGTQVLAVWTSDPSKAALAVVEKGGLLADGTPAPARRVMPFSGGGNVRPVNEAGHPAEWVVIYEYMTPAGKALLHRCVQWALGETPTAVADWGNQ